MELNEEQRAAFIADRMREYASNIDEFSISQNVYDVDEALCSITEKTINSICVFIKAKTEHGIDNTSWFDMRSFNDRFSTNIDDAKQKQIKLQQHLAKQQQNMPKVKSEKQQNMPKAKSEKQQTKKMEESNNKSSLDKFMEGKYKTT